MEPEVSMQDEVLEEAIIKPKEQRIVDVLTGKEMKMGEIMEATGLGKSSLMETMKELKGMGWVFYSERWQTWKLNPNVKFRCVHMNNGFVVDEQDRISVTYRTPLKSSFQKKKHERFVDTSLKIGWTTPEEYRRSFIEETSHFRLIDKKGGAVLNENYNPDYRAGRTSGAGKTEVR